MKSFLEDRARYAFVTELHWKDLKLLLQQNKRFSESETVLYAAEITLALQHLHKRKFIYRYCENEGI